MAILEKVKQLPWEHKLEADEITENSLCETNNTTENSSDKTSETTESKCEETELSLEEEAKKEKGHPKRSLDEENRYRAAKRKRRRIAAGYREDPFVFFKDDQEDVWLSIR